MSSHDFLNGRWTKALAQHRDLPILNQPLAIKSNCSLIIHPKYQVIHDIYSTQSFKRFIYFWSSYAESKHRPFFTCLHISLKIQEIINHSDKQKVLWKGCTSKVMLFTVNQNWGWPLNLTIFQSSFVSPLILSCNT